jgi:hypothetical protein
MKKNLYTLFFFLSLATMSANAQLNKDLSPTLRFGFTVGVNITQMSYDVNSAIKDLAKNGAGVLAGPTVIYTMPAIGLGVDGAVMFDYRSSKISGTAQNTTIDSRLNFTSIQIPLNVRYGIDIADMINAFVFAGPQYNIRLNKGTVDVAGADWTPCNSPLSMNFGIGLVAMEIMQFRINYNLATKKSGDFIYNGNWRGSGKANALQVSVTYLF